MPDLAAFAGGGGAHNSGYQAANQLTQDTHTIDSTAPSAAGR